MTVNKLANKDIALVFERVGGLKAMVKWIKASNENRTKFYLKYGSEIAAVIAAQSTPRQNKASSEQINGIIGRALYGAIGARQRGDDQAAPTQVAGVIDARPRSRNIDTDKSGGNRDIADNSAASQPESQQLKSNADHVQSTPATSKPPASPPKPSAPRRDAPVGLYAGVLDGSNDGLTSTEKFYLWNGHGRW